MSENSHPFVRFLSLYRALNKSYSVSRADCFDFHQDAVAILAFVCSENQKLCYPTISRVVQQIEFGTPPTVQRRLNELLQHGLIEFCVGENKRHRHLKLTMAGKKYLDDCAKLMREVLGSCGCECCG